MDLKSNAISRARIHQQEATKAKESEPVEIQMAKNEPPFEILTFKTSIEDGGDKQNSTTRKSKRPELARYQPPGSRTFQIIKDQNTIEKNEVVSRKTDTKVENNEPKKQQKEKSSTDIVSVNIPKPISLLRHRPSEPTKLSTVSDSSNRTESNVGGILKLRPDAMRDILNKNEKQERENDKQERKMIPIRRLQDNNKVKVLFDPNNPTKPIYMPDRVDISQPLLHASISTPIMHNFMFGINFFFFSLYFIHSLIDIS
jgi:hypothetical protein